MGAVSVPGSPADVEHAPLETVIQVHVVHPELTASEVRERASGLAHSAAASAEQPIEERDPWEVWVGSSCRDAAGAHDWAAFSCFIPSALITS